MFRHCCDIRACMSNVKSMLILIISLFLHCSCTQLKQQIMLFLDYSNASTIISAQVQCAMEVPYFLISVSVMLRFCVCLCLCRRWIAQRHWVNLIGSLLVWTIWMSHNVIADNLLRFIGIWESVRSGPCYPPVPVTTVGAILRQYEWNNSSKSAILRPYII